MVLIFISIYFEWRDTENQQLRIQLVGGGWPVGYLHNAELGSTGNKSW